MQSRPLPQIPDISDDIRNLRHPMDGTSRWMSKENLLSHDENGAQLFVALYDFQSGGENQLSLRKGSKFGSLSYQFCSCVIHAILFCVNYFVPYDTRIKFLKI